MHLDISSNMPPLPCLAAFQEYLIVEYWQSKIENISCIWKEKTTHYKFRIKIKNTSLKIIWNSRAIFANTSRGQLDGGSDYFHETFAHYCKCFKFVIFIKICVILVRFINICVFSRFLSVNYNKTYSLRLLSRWANVSWKLSLPPRQVAHEKCSRRLRVNFKLFLNLCFWFWFWICNGGFFY